MYLTTGYPERDSVLELVPALVEAGSDIVELGVPFSDPLADGATVQRATERALRNGIRPADCISTVRSLRGAGIDVPILLMGYYNPMLQYGLERFCADLASAGGDGLIVPDLPPEEAQPLHRACRANELDLIFLLAPTSTDQRIAEVAELASGFIYCVSLTGTTGERAELPPELPSFIERVRRATHTPLAVGFGISEPRHARQVAQVAEGVIVGSKLLSVVEQSADRGAEAVREFVRSLREGMDEDRH
jgi:tryptophan synthase alpha chain